MNETAEMKSTGLPSPAVLLKVTGSIPSANSKINRCERWKFCEWFTEPSALRRTAPYGLRMSTPSSWKSEENFLQTVNFTPVLILFSGRWPRW